MNELFRRTGIEIIGDVPWGTHFCHVYHRLEDLLLLELPFIQAGLQDQEACWWILPEHLTPQAARDALRQVVPDLELGLQCGQIELTSLPEVGACSSLQYLTGQLQSKLKQALEAGFQGLRVVHAISGPWHGRDSLQLEKHLESGLQDVPVLVLCLVPNDPRHFSDTLKMASQHSRVLVWEEEEWQIITDLPTLKQTQRAERERQLFWDALYENVRRRADEMAAIVTFSSDLRQAVQRNDMLPVILNHVLKLLNALGAALVFRSGPRGELIVEQGQGIWAGMSESRLPAADMYTIQAMESIQPQLVTDAGLLSAFQDQNDPAHLAVAICVPLVVQQQPVGALWVGLEKALASDDLHLLLAVAEIAANALHRAALNEKTEERLQQLTTLHAVETMVNASLDVGIVIGILLDRLTGNGGASAADVLLLNPYNQVFEISASRGFRIPPPRSLRLRLNEDLAGRALQARRSIVISSLASYSEHWPRYRLMQNEKIQTFVAVPLFSKGQVKGILEIFFRRVFKPDQEWMEFVEGLGNQLAIAIDNSSLVAELHRSNLELVQAYDVTLEGWARTLRLRNDETEEHTHRLIDYTMALARALKVDETELIHLRRGVLLHDIGKLGIPDSVLKNPGELNADEWEIMRRHPQTAYELLSPVSYLQPILDIPYCHHERWDGSGYPRGLVGEQIPLAARLFAVVDVWDALTSHRIYRPAWSLSQAAQYLREQAGSLFDPHIVDVFLAQCIPALPDQRTALLKADEEPL